MITITQAVRKALTETPFLVEVLCEELANTTGVARRIKPKIEKILREKVTESSIAVALRRITGELKRPQFGATFLKQLRDITVRSNLVEFVFPNIENLPHILEKLSKDTHKRKDVFLNFSQGVHESIVVINAEYAATLRVLLIKGKPQVINDLSAITIRLPESSLAVPGVYYPILKALATEGISFVEIMSVNTELSILFKDNDVDSAFTTIKQIMS